MAITLLVNGVSRKTRTLEQSLRWTNALNRRDTLEVTFREHYSNPPPAVDGNTIALTDGGVPVFGGFVDAPEVSQEGNSNFLIYKCSARDYSSIPQRRLVSAVYDNMTLAAIVADINTNFLDGEGITLGEVETGPMIERAVFNYVYADQAFNELSGLSGMPWWIDPARVMHFKTRASMTAPTAVTDTNYIDMSVTPSREDYRNRQYVRAGVDLTDARTESLKGDGTRRVFNLAFQVGEQPTITVNSVAKTVGILGVESGKDWYWNKGKTEIAQSDSGVVLTTGDTLEVTYRGLFPILVAAQLDAEITARAAVESGTSGVWEHVEDHPNIDTGGLALDTANALLQRWGQIGKVVSVTTFAKGYRAGQLVPITNTKLGLAGTYLIESVQASEYCEPDAAGEPRLVYAVKALEGDFKGGWVAFFTKLAEMGRQYVIRDNEVLVLLRSREDPVTLTDVLTVTTGTAETRIDFATIDYSEVA